MCRTKKKQEGAFGRKQMLYTSVFFLTVFSFRAYDFFLLFPVPRRDLCKA